jgi:hypothetical protein
VYVAWYRSYQVWLQAPFKLPIQAPYKLCTGFILNLVSEND